MCEKKQFKYCPSKIDHCLRFLLQAINNGNMETLGSCCGHGKYPMTIVVRNKYEPSIIFELMSGKIIQRKKRFYRKDEEGYYYIPETI